MATYDYIDIKDGLPWWLMLPFSVAFLVVGGLTFGKCTDSMRPPPEDPRAGAKLYCIAMSGQDCVSAFCQGQLCDVKLIDSPTVLHLACATRGCNVIVQSLF